jgi:protein gp37
MFHPHVPIEFIALFFNVMASATLGCGLHHKHTEECWTGTQHTFQILTKRAERMLSVTTQELAAEIAEWPGDSPLSMAMELGDWPLRNVLLQTPAAVRFVSYEPALGPLSFVSEAYKNRLTDGVKQTRIDWVIAGGESGPGARPSHPDWFISVRDQCQAAGVPFFFKQWGEWAGDHFVTNREAGPAHAYEFPDGLRVFKAGKKRAGRLLDGREWSEFPQK